MQRINRVKLRYGLKSLLLVCLIAGIIAAIVAPVIRPLLNGFELVGLEITPVGWVALILLLSTLALGVAFFACRRVLKRRVDDVA